MYNYKVVTPQGLINFYPGCSCTVNVGPGCGGTVNLGCS